jgi:hypothetical protein
LIFCYDWGGIVPARGFFSVMLWFGLLQLIEFVMLCGLLQVIQQLQRITQIPVEDIEDFVTVLIREVQR